MTDTYRFFVSGKPRQGSPYGDGVGNVTVGWTGQKLLGDMLPLLGIGLMARMAEGRPVGLIPSGFSMTNHLQNPHSALYLARQWFDDEARVLGLRVPVFPKSSPDQQSLDGALPQSEQKSYDPQQTRDASGRWSTEGGGDTQHESIQIGFGTKPSKKPMADPMLGPPPTDEEWATAGKQVRAIGATLPDMTDLLASELRSPEMREKMVAAGAIMTDLIKRQIGPSERKLMELETEMERSDKRKEGLDDQLRYITNTPEMNALRQPITEQCLAFTKGMETERNLTFNQRVAVLQEQIGFDDTPAREKRQIELLRLNAEEKTQERKMKDFVHQAWAPYHEAVRKASVPIQQNIDAEALFFNGLAQGRMRAKTEADGVRQAAVAKALGSVRPMGAQKPLKIQAKEDQIGAEFTDTLKRIDTAYPADWWDGMRTFLQQPDSVFMRTEQPELGVKPNPGGVGGRFSVSRIGTLRAEVGRLAVTRDPLRAYSRHHSGVLALGSKREWFKEDFVQHGHRDEPFGNADDFERWFRQNDARTAVHELGHWMEFTVNGLPELTEGFLDYRADGKKATKMGFPYGDHERAVKDHFADKYMGIRYPRDADPPATEILSCGIEDWWCGKWRTWRTDPEYAHFVLGTLALLPGESRPA